LKIKKLIVIVVSFLAILQLAITNARANKNASNYANKKSQFMSVDEIKPGQIGECLTVLKNSQITKLKVEILGVQKNVFGFGRDWIVVKFHNNSIIEKAGIIAGMSGSPVYINGKLIGAIAYADNFEKEPIGYVTPIKEVFEIAKQRNIAPYSNDDRIKKTLLWTSSGFNKKTFEIISKTNIASINNFPMITTMSGKTSQNVLNVFSNDNSNLQAGSMVGIQLMRGDLDITAYGTVIYRNGQFLYLFGHPLTGIGKVEYPITKVDVLGIMPNYESSYKICNSKEFIGTAIFDGFGGVLAKLGKQPHMIPISIKINDQQFYIEVVNHRILTPLLIKYAVINSILYKQPSDNLTLKFTEFLKIKNYPKYIQIEKVLSGGYEQILFRLTLEMVFHDLILNNEFHDTQIEKAYFYIKILPEKRELKIIDFVSEKNDVSPGSKFASTIFFYKYNKGVISKKIFVELPKELPSDILTFEISNADIDGLLNEVYLIANFFTDYSPQNQSFEKFIKALETKPGLYLIIIGSSPLVHKISVIIDNKKAKILNYNENDSFAIFDLSSDEFKNFQISGLKTITINIK